MIFARIHQYLSMATPLLWTRQPDTIGVLGLALNATNERNGNVPEELERIRELLSTARDLWRAAPEIEDEQEKRQRQPDDVSAHPPGGHLGGDGRCLS